MLRRLADGGRIVQIRPVLADMVFRASDVALRQQWCGFFHKCLILFIRTTETPA
jgi:hypothetical protein